MAQRVNEFGQPIGADVPGWAGAQSPSHAPMQGRFCRLEALSVAQHAADLFAAYSKEGGEALWTYMPVGPFATEAAFRAWAEPAAGSSDPLFFAVIDLARGKAVGIVSYLRITPAAGTIEVGNIAYSPLLQRTPIATEVMFLMMQRAFDELGNRRYEWKCDALNAPSRQAAARYGFSYDGLFPQALVYKGRNRDTAWFSMLDKDWPAIRSAYQAWLAPANFDAQGQQKTKLAERITEALAK